MKLTNLIFLIAFCCTSFYGCVSKGPSRKNAMKELRENNYDFKIFAPQSYRGIYFDAPDVFEISYVIDHMYKGDGLSLDNEQIGVYLSIEQFNKSEAETFLFSENGDYSELDVVHSFYIQQRENSLKYATTSVKEDFAVKTKLPAAFQVVMGRRDNISEDLIYMIATVEKNNEWYVFQFVCNAELSSYLLDDFKDIIKSAR